MILFVFSTVFMSYKFTQIENKTCQCIHLKHNNNTHVIKHGTLFLWFLYMIKDPRGLCTKILYALFDIATNKYYVCFKTRMFF